MLFELMFMTLIGAICIWLGILIWRKERITLIHAYHYTRVAEEDKKAYTALVGKALLLMGVGMILTGIIDFITNTTNGWFCFGACLGIGLVMMWRAQKRYNGGIF